MKSLYNQTEQDVYEKELYGRIISNVVNIVKQEAIRVIAITGDSGKNLTFNEGNATRIELESFLNKLLDNFKVAHKLPYLSQQLTSLEIQHVVAFEIAGCLLHKPHLKFTREQQGKIFGLLEHGVHIFRYLAGSAQNAERHNRGIVIENLIPRPEGELGNIIMDYSIVFSTLHNRLRLAEAIKSEKLVGDTITKDELIYERQFNTQPLDASAQDIKNRLHINTGFREPHVYINHFLDFTVTKRRSFYVSHAVDAIDVALLTLGVEKIKIQEQHQSSAAATINNMGGSRRSSDADELSVLTSILPTMQRSFVERLDDSKSATANLAVL